MEISLGALAYTTLTASRQLLRLGRESKPTHHEIIDSRQSATRRTDLARIAKRVQLAISFKTHLPDDYSSGSPISFISSGVSCSLATPARRSPGVQ